MSLSTRFALQFGLTAAVTIAAVLAATLGLIALRWSSVASELGSTLETTITTQLRRDGEALLGAVALDAGEALAAADSETLDRIAAEALRRSSAVALAIYDADGRMLADGSGTDTVLDRVAPRALRGLTASDGTVRWQEGPLLISGRAMCPDDTCIGAMAVSLDGSVIARERRQADERTAAARRAVEIEAGIVGIVALLVGTALAALVGWLVGRRLTKSLKAAVAGLEQLASGSVNVAFEAKEAELRELASAVEKVAERLTMTGPEQDAILTDMADGLFVVVEGRLVIANPALHALFGSADGTLVGTEAAPLFGLAPQPDAEALRAALSGVVRIDKADGATVPVMVSVKVSPGREGQPPRVIGVIRDVADRVAMEQKLLEAQLRAEAADKAKAEFLAVMSHELRTPLNGVLGGAAVLAGSDLTDNQRSLVGIVQNSGRSLLTMVSSILDFTRTDPAAAQVEQAPVDLEALARQIVNHIADDAAQKGLAVNVRVQPGVPGILSDEDKLLEIGQKLAENAVKFTQEGSVGIDISYDRDGNKLAFSLSVDDTGIGIDASKRAAIFDMFTQGDSSERRVHTGTGMGLAITKRLAALLDGEITVESEPGVGTTFRVALTAPIDPDAPATAPPKAVQEARTMVVAASARERDTLVEQLAAAGAATEAFETAGDAMTALEAALAEGNPFGLVVHPEDLADFEPSGLAAWLRSSTENGATASVVVRAAQPPRRGPNGLPDRVQSVTGPLTGSLLLEAADAALAAGRAEQNDDEGPASKPSEAAAAFEAIPLAIATAPAPLPRVLLAEANEVNRIVLGAYLKKAGYVVDTVDNGFEAVRRYKEERPSLILMDVDMPVMNGLEATKGIRAFDVEEGLVSVPIIGLAAPRREGERERCAAAGMNDHLPKPIKIEELEAKLERWTQLGGAVAKAKSLAS